MMEPVHKFKGNALRPGQTLETRALPHPSQQAWVRPCPYGLAASLPGAGCFPGGLFPVARRADSPEVFYIIATTFEDRHHMVHFVGYDSAAVQPRLAFVVIARHDVVSYCFWYAPGSGTPGVGFPPWHIWHLPGEQVAAGVVTGRPLGDYRGCCHPDETL